MWWYIFPLTRAMRCWPACLAAFAWVRAWRWYLCADLPPADQIFWVSFLQLKAPHIPIGRMMLILDCFVLAAAAIVYRNIEASLFGLIAMYASAQVMDGILYGLENGKLVHIVSTQNDEITKDIIAHLNRSATILKGRGAYSGTEMDVIMVVVRKTEFFKLKTLVHSHDPNAFIVVTEAGEIIGEGWKPIDKEN